VGSARSTKERTRWVQIIVCM